MDIKPPINVPQMHCTGPADVKYEMVADKENDQFVSVSSMGYFLHSGHNLSSLQEDGVNLLTLRGNVPKQYAYNLMDALFTVEEMGTHCFRENSKTTKPGLDMKRVKLLEGRFHCYLSLCVCVQVGQGESVGKYYKVNYYA